MEGAGRGRGGEKRRRYPQTPFIGAKIGASGTLMEGAGRGRGGEKRRRLPANPFISTWKIGISFF